MENNNLIRIDAQLETISMDSFADIENPEFREICCNIATTVNSAVVSFAEKQREMAVYLAAITPEMYQSIGYKSLADFAAERFHIKKALTHSLATAGHIYNDDRICGEVKKLSPSKVVELAGATVKAPSGVAEAMIDKVNNDAKAGKLDSMTQKDLREYSKETQASFSAKPLDSVDDKPKPVAMYVVKPIVHVGADNEIDATELWSKTAVVYSNLGAVDLKENEEIMFTKEEINRQVKDGLVFKTGLCDYTDETERKHENISRFVTFDRDGFPVAFVAYKYEAPKKVVNTNKTKTAALDLASLTADEIKALQAQLAALMGNK